MARVDWSRVWTAAVLAALGGYSGWQTYQHTLAPGPKIVWAGLSFLVMVGGLCLIRRTLVTAGPRFDNGKVVRDARGELRVIAFVESRGLLVRDMPRDLRESIALLGASNFFQHLRWPPWKTIVIPGAMVGALGLLSWGGKFAFNLGVPLLLMGVFAASFDPLPEHMMRLLLKHRRCASCAYDLAGTPVQPDLCTVCPECGAAWRLPANTSLRSASPSEV